MKLPEGKTLLHGAMVDKEHPTKAVIKNHYGVTVNSEEPVTGVFQNNRVDYLWDDIQNSENLAYDYALEEEMNLKITSLVALLEEDNYVHVKDYQKLRDMVDALDEFDLDSVESNYLLIGFKKVFSEEMNESWYWFDTLGYGYLPDPDAEFSAIVSESVTQVIASKWRIRGALCSPCYPGQVDADTEGYYLGYSLPQDYFDSSNPMKNRIERAE